MSGPRAVFVEAPSRLHMGLIDLRGDFGRRFGGIGAALEAPSLLIEARAAQPKPSRLRRPMAVALAVKLVVPSLA